MKKILLTVSLVLMPWSISSLANEGSNKAAKNAQSFEDVESLVDRVAQLDGQKVTVVGEVQNKLDKRSFVLEGGGIINDEIVVVGANNAKGVKLDSLKKDAKINVMGTIRTMPVVEVRRELSWDLDPQIETELDGVVAYLVADEVKTAE